MTGQESLCAALWPGCQREDCAWPEQPCVADAAAPGQLGWLRYTERVEQEVFPDSRPRSEVIVEVESDWGAELRSLDRWLSHEAVKDRPTFPLHRIKRYREGIAAALASRRVDE